MTQDDLGIDEGEQPSRELRKRRMKMGIEWNIGDGGKRCMERHAQLRASINLQLLRLFAHEVSYQ